MVNVIILCGGPPKPNRERHLEIFNNKPLINGVIDNSMIVNADIYVLLNKDNINLKNHILKDYGDKIKILENQSLKMYDTFKLALSIKGKSILVMGDLINLKIKTIEDFNKSKYSSAISKYKHPWGRNLISSTNKIRRSDIGDAIMSISEEDKKEFLSLKNYESAINLFKDFYPERDINFEVQNDIGTHMTYSFFYNISSNPNVDEDYSKGVVFCDYEVYADND